MIICQYKQVTQSATYKIYQQLLVVILDLVLCASFVSQPNKLREDTNWQKTVKASTQADFIDLIDWVCFNSKVEADTAV